MTKARDALLTGLLAAVLAAPAAIAADARGGGHGSGHGHGAGQRLERAVTAQRIREHLERFQQIATRNDGNRSLGTEGYDASVRYVVNRLVRAGYGVYVQPFTANLFSENAPAELQQIMPNPATYVVDTDFATMEYSGSGDETALLVPTLDIMIPPGPNPSDSNSGCEAADYPVETTGNIALIQRGTCTFEEKAVAAAAAGAVGVIIFNEGQPGREELLTGTLTSPQGIPVVGTTFALGEELYAAATAGPVTMRIAVDSTVTPVETANVLAERRGQVRDQDVVVGAHLDSVVDGPGINDNGSGSATILTIAEQMAKLRIRPRNTVRFAFWGAEEQGLFGSNFYVNNLTDQQFERIALNLNFDMVGSPNFVRFVYDGDGDAFGTAGPTGSDVIERIFNRYFRRQGLATDPTAFDGRSDYFAFINVGIPAGGLFSGAEGIKTPEQERKYGGQAGLAYDPCYHQACDTIFNLSRRALDQFGKAAAHAVYHFAMTRQDITPDAAAARTALSAAARSAEYRGPHLVR